jgi:hypothetical protein
MLKIQYNSEFLDLTKDTAIELERDSPYYLLDSVLGEFTMTLTIPYTPKNARLLGTIFFDYSIKAKTPYTVSVYDDATFRYQCLLICTTTNTDNGILGKGNVQAYLLNNISVFYDQIKDKLMSKLKYSGILTFNFTTDNVTDGSNGYIQHFWNTAANFDTVDYVVAPCRNDSATTEYINQIGGWQNFINITQKTDTTTTYLTGTYYVPQQNVYPFPKLTSTLYYLFKEFGWTLDTSNIIDTDWKKLVLYNANPLQLFVNQYPLSDAYLPSISFSMAQFFSPEVKVVDFLLGIFKRYNWIPLFDSISKTCILVAAKDYKQGTLKDFTRYLQNAVSNDYSADQRILGWKINYGGNDSAITTPDFTNFTQFTPVVNKSYLPTPAAQYDNALIYSWQENQWWQITIDTTVTPAVRTWSLFGDNIYDYQPAKNFTTDSYETIIGTMPSYRTQIDVHGTTIYYGYFPYCNQDSSKEFGVRTLFFHGTVNCTQQVNNGINVPSAYQYPLLSSLCSDNLGLPITAWSNVYTHVNPNTKKDWGIYQYWWKDFCDHTNVLEAETINLNLPLHELVNLKWTDRILFKNVPYFLQQVIEPIPYKGFLQAVRRRILLDLNENPSQLSIGGNPLVYLRFEWANTGSFDDLNIDWTNGKGFGFDSYNYERDKNMIGAQALIKAYSDPAGTIPMEVVNLPVRIFCLQVRSDTNVVQATVTLSIVMNGSSYNLYDATYLLTQAGVASPGYSRKQYDYYMVNATPPVIHSVTYQYPMLAKYLLDDSSQDYFVL